MVEQTILRNHPSDGTEEAPSLRGCPELNHELAPRPYHAVLVDYSELRALRRALTMTAGVWGGTAEERQVYREIGLAIVDGIADRFYNLPAPDPGPRPILCAHADRNGEGMHVLAPGERCMAADAPSDAYRALRAAGIS